ncbi:hypothetical protein ALQ72_200012 [Pseudomonas syringae pv. maculicola]|nr:hypothetical protein ALQ72_200012 [Pseudomonas syringae pv. maculicola]RMN80711.1 hypothetical protein ALQ52_200155 [Pseudomonas cannabina pv. alisalensis]
MRLNIDDFGGVYAHALGLVHFLFHCPPPCTAQLHGCDHTIQSDSPIALLLEAPTSHLSKGPSSSLSL